jgi:hypothetical protein
MSYSVFFSVNNQKSGEQITIYFLTELQCVASPNKPGICYTFGQIKMSLADATDTCRSSGGFLAVTDTQDEIDFITVRQIN